MKLQKNNKYSKRIISGIANILLAGSILIGCNNIEAFASTAETTIDEIQEDEVNKKANVKEEVREEFEKDEKYD